MNYKESITALLEGLKGIFENKTATEASAIAQASTKPSTIFYTSDTHAIVVGGQVYGRSNQVSADAPFSYLPADVSSPSADPQFDGNHDTIYIQPIKTGSDAGKIKLWWYVNGAWTSSDTLDLVLPTDASDITYDLTATPDLGNGDVQSAIEALDGKVEKVAEDVVRTGYLIASWEDDKILTSTTYAVGSTIGEWGNGVRYGCRGVRLNVKEGDKVLLDTYSPALFGLIFTDENRVVKALYDDRRFDGVWTAPVNGYCYIQDVLYRDNFHYSSAHGHLAYMAHDTRKRVAKGGDWYMQLAPRLFSNIMPWSKHWVYGNDASIYFSPTAADWVTAGVLNTFTLVMARYKVENCTAPETLYIRARYKNTDSNAIYSTGQPGRDELMDGYCWFFRIYRNEVTRADCSFRLWIQGADSTTSFDLIVENVFLHSSSDFGELYKLAQKIINGEVEVDNFYGVREKEVDFVRNAIGLQSISDLGYNILEHGATLPIDEEGYKYAKEIYERYKDNPPTSGYAFRQLFKNDTKLIYAPYIDCSHTPTAWHQDRYSETFEGCHNLVCVPPFDTIPEGAGGGIYCCFDACRSLKRVEGFGDMPIQSITAAFRNCYSLEYIAKLNTHNMTTLSNTNTYAYCYSLERIEELDAYSVNANQGNIFQQSVGLRYCLIKNIGHNANNFTNYINFQSNTLYGVPNDKHPDARQSLVDSLLTYSYDRVNDPDGLGTAGTTCTITLSANSYAQLTASEIEQITAKGYTLTHP